MEKENQTAVGELLELPAATPVPFSSPSEI